jgi:hypothetical protein
MRIRSGVAGRIIKATLACLGVYAVAGMASAQTLVGAAIELHGGALEAASAPVLSNGSGTLHVEATTLGEPIRGHAAGPVSGIQLFSGTVPVPEPAALLQVGSGALGLILLQSRRRLRLPSPDKSTTENA